MSALSGQVALITGGARELGTSMARALREVRLETSLEYLLERSALGDGPAVLGTVVSTTGSTYRKRGARMLLSADGSYHGLLSGGCLELDLAIHARGVLESGEPRAVEYDMRGADDLLFGIGTGCEGAIRVLLEPAGAASPAALAAAHMTCRSGRSTSLVVVHESNALRLGTYAGDDPALPRALVAAAADSLRTSSSGELVVASDHQRLRALVQFLAPAPHLLVCGAGPDVKPVIAMARSLCWRVTVADHRPAYANDCRLPGVSVLLVHPGALHHQVNFEDCDAAVVMSHHLPADLAYLAQLADADSPAYVGLLGPKARRQRLASELGPRMDRLNHRLYAPVGLDLGAATPEGIALSIIGQIHAWLARGSRVRSDLNDYESTIESRKQVHAHEE